MTGPAAEYREDPRRSATLFCHEAATDCHRRAMRYEVGRSEHGSNTGLGHTRSPRNFPW